MASSYNLIGSRPSIWVLSPTTVIPAQVCTITTIPSGVTADLWVNGATFDAGGAGPELTAFADNIESIIAQGQATGGTPSSSLDPSGLTQTFVTFTVAYTPPGSPVGPITTDVDVPTGLLSESDPTISATLMAQAESMIDDAYQNLVSAANG